jgi:preprotein translocase subunit YajC
MLWTIAFAQSQAASAAGKPGILESLFPLAVILFIFYFLVGRPQQKRAKEHKGFVEGLKRGDTVITSGGIYGEIAGITDQVITLQIAENVKIKILKSQIAKSAKEEAKA